MCSLFQWIIVPLLCEGQREGDQNVSSVTFGHGARHLVGRSQLEPHQVEAAIQFDVYKRYNGNPLSKGTWKQHEITVHGERFEYRVYSLGKGVYNVGTYFPI